MEIAKAATDENIHLVWEVIDRQAEELIKVDFSDLDPLKLQLIKYKCEQSFLYFLRIFFGWIQGQYFKTNWHHEYECELAEQIFYGKHKRAIINVAAGSTKTEIWSIHWIAWCILKCISDPNNPRSTRWLPLSYSADLVIENSVRVMEILDSEEFNSMWQLIPSKTTKSRNNWLYFDKNGNRHRLYGTSTSGQVTGRRAGYMTPDSKNNFLFTGALILDDPLPPKDADSGVLVDKSNKQLNRVVRSRLAENDIPIIMVQQRICSGDTTDFLMSDNAPDTYTLFKIPALLNRMYIDSLDEKTKKRCIEDTRFKDIEVSYWIDKEPTEALKKMQKADNFMFSAQYMQEPDNTLRGGGVYKKEMDLVISEGRVCHIPIESSLKTYTSWDLGINDHMVIWIIQTFQYEIRLLACYGNRDLPMTHYIKFLKDFASKHDLTYVKHYAPHDIVVRDLMTKKTRIEQAKRLGIDFTIVQRVKRKNDGITALKQIFNRLYFDEKFCDADSNGKHGQFARYTGIKALQALHREWDYDHERYKDEVSPKWATDFTDALQQFALGHKEENKAKPKQKKLNNYASSQGWQE